MEPSSLDRVSKLLLAIIGPQLFVVLVVVALFSLLRLVFDVQTSDAMALAIPTLWISSIAAGVASIALVKRRRRASPQSLQKLIKKTVFLVFVASIDFVSILLLALSRYRNFDLVVTLFLLFAISVFSLVLLRVGRSFVADVDELSGAGSGDC